jgi:hypothetical protein
MHTINFKHLKNIFKMYFPITCVDNFFDNPSSIVELANSLSYHKCDYFNQLWPGSRTMSLSKIDSKECADFVTLFSSKVLRLFNPTIDRTPWIVDIDISFQKISFAEYEDASPGLIHRDGGCKLAGIVYLNKNIDSSCGTSIYKRKTFFTVDDSSYNIVRKEYFTNYDKTKIEEYKNFIETHNSHFVETIKVSNVYNRLLTYDGSIYHGVPNFYDKNEKDRLTLVFFMNNITINSFPIPEMRTVQL